MNKSIVDEVNEYIQDTVKELYTGCCHPTLQNIIDQVDADYPHADKIIKEHIVETIVDKLHELEETD